MTSDRPGSSSRRLSNTAAWDTSCDSLELDANGDSLLEKRVARECNVLWDAGVHAVEEAGLISRRTSWPSPWPAPPLLGPLGGPFQRSGVRREIRPASSTAWTPASHS